MSIQNTRETQRVVLDSSALIELLEGSTRGIKIDAELGGKQLCVCAYSITEVCAKVLRQNKNDEKVFRDILAKALVIHVDSKLALHAARLYFVLRKKKPKISFGDALAYVAADDYEAKFITCDNDFAGVKNATVIR